MAKDRFAAGRTRDALRRPGSSWGPNAEWMTLEQRQQIKRLGLEKGVDVGSLEGVTYEEALDVLAYLDNLPSE